MKAQSDCVYTDFKYFAYTKGGGGAVPLFYAVKEVSKAHQGCIWSMNFNYKK